MFLFQNDEEVHSYNMKMLVILCYLNAHIFLISYHMR